MDLQKIRSAYFLQKRQDKCTSTGLVFRYHVNPRKTWLITKEQLLSEAKDTFEGMEAHITAQDRPYMYLASALGCKICDKNTRMEGEHFLQQMCLYIVTFMQLSQLSHTALQTRSHLCQEPPQILTSYYMHPVYPLDDVIQSKLIPAWTCQARPNHTVHELFAVHAQIGGLGVITPSLPPSKEFSSSVDISSPFSQLNRSLAS